MTSPTDWTNLEGLELPTDPTSAFLLDTTSPPPTSVSDIVSSMTFSTVAHSIDNNNEVDSGQVISNVHIDAMPVLVDGADQDLTNELLTSAPEVSWPDSSKTANFASDSIMTTIPVDNLPSSLPMPAIEVATKDPVPPEDSVLNRTDFKLLNKVYRVLEKLESGDVQGCTKEIITLRETIEQCRKTIRELPGADHSRAEQNVILAREHAVLEQKRNKLQQYAMLPLLQNLSNLATNANASSSPDVPPDAMDLALP